MIIGILIISITCVLIACITSNTIKNIYSLKYLGRPYDPLMEELKECDRCGEWNFEDDLIDTEGLTGGGVGYYCYQCIKDCGVGS